LDSSNPSLIAQSPLIDHLRLVAEKQSAVSGYPVLFFESLSPDSKSIFYLISGWSSVAAHYEWIHSQTNQELLVLLKDFVGVKGLAHVSVDFNEMRCELETDCGVILQGPEAEGDLQDPQTGSGSRNGILAVSFSEDGMLEQMHSFRKSSWTKEGFSLDEDEESKRIVYRFTWFATNCLEDVVATLTEGGENSRVILMAHCHMDKENV
ncbi:MAG: hypothetical protein NXY57DRAFT_1011617, partial [Lentinula lateritia]